MEKYRIGLSAILLAFIFCSFKHESISQKTFSYIAPGGDYSTAAVQNPQNWVLVLIVCPNSTNKACDVIIDITTVQNPGATRLDLVDPNIELTAEQGTSEAALVDVQISGVTIIIIIRNRP